MDHTPIVKGVNSLRASLSKKDLEYWHESNAVSPINIHFVFIPKRRKAVLVGKIAERLQEIIFEVVTENRWKVIALEIVPDRVH